MPKWQEQATEKLWQFIWEPSSAIFESKQLYSMYLFLYTVYIIWLADKRTHTHKHTEIESNLYLSGTLCKQALSVKRIRHLLLSGTVHIHSPKTVLQNHKQKRPTHKQLRHNRACCKKQETGAENFKKCTNWTKHTVDLKMPVLWDKTYQASMGCSTTVAQRIISTTVSSLLKCFWSTQEFFTAQSLFSTSKS